MKRFPRVLIVTKSQIGDLDSAGAALRSWFKEWPRDRLAQIFSGVPAARNVFCERGFQLGPEERRLGKSFFRLKGSSLGDAALPYRRAGVDGAASPRSSLLSKATRAGGKALVESGVWEVIFKPRLSPRLRAWIEGFKPEVMFVQGCDISFMRLPMMIQAAYGTPIHFDVVDDWVMHLYRGSWGGSLMNRIVQRTFRDLVGASARRYTIGDAMAEAYQARYGVPFTPLMQCDDRERFALARPVREGARATPEIVYSGSLALGRWKALLDLAQACARLRSEGQSIAITAYAPFVPSEASDALRAVPGLTVKGALPDAEVPGVLAAADLLFLPESFDPGISDYIKLSVSTKAHLYMMSGRPSLVYGPAGIGTVEYARRHGWAHVVDREGSSPLAAALDVLLRDPRRGEELVERARIVSAGNHSGPIVRESLRQSLLSSCA